MALAAIIVTRQSVDYRRGSSNKVALAQDPFAQELAAVTPVAARREQAEQLLAKARREMKELGKRMEAKGVAGNMVGDGLVKGGVLCIAPDGELKHTFYEDAGKGIPDDELKQIVAAVEAFGVVKGVVTPVGEAAAAPVE